MLRPGEANDLLCEDLCFLEIDENEIGVFICVIREPKPARKYASVQHVIVDEPDLVRFLRWLLEGRDPKENFYGLGAGTFAKRLETLLKALGLAGQFTPAGLRAGGATWEWVRRRNFGGLRLRGRGSASRTLEHYVQECVAELAQGTLSSEKRSQLRSLGNSGMTLLAYVVC